MLQWMTCELEGLIEGLVKGVEFMAAVGFCERYTVLFEEYYTEFISFCLIGRSLHVDRMWWQGFD